MDVDKGAPGDHWGDARNTVTVAEPVTGGTTCSNTPPVPARWNTTRQVLRRPVPWRGSRRRGTRTWESQSVFAKNLDDVDARSVTQLAIWIASGQVRVEGGEDSSKATEGGIGGKSGASGGWGRLFERRPAEFRPLHDDRSGVASGAEGPQCRRIATNTRPCSMSRSEPQAPCNACCMRVGVPKKAHPADGDDA